MGPPAAAFGQTAVADQAACERLATSLKLPSTVITAAQVVAAGQFAPPQGAAQGFGDLPAFCRVAATVAPSSDSDIKMEAVRRGYAAASTDTGHTGGSASFALGHPEKLTDFAHRAIHEMAAQGKATTTSTLPGGATSTRR